MDPDAKKGPNGIMVFFVTFFITSKGSITRNPNPNEMAKAQIVFESPSQMAKAAPILISPPPKPLGMNCVVRNKRNPVKIKLLAATYKSTREKTFIKQKTAPVKIYKLL